LASAWDLSTALLGLVFGIQVFWYLSQQNPAYLKTLREHVRFFFTPFSPSVMIIIKKLDGTLVSLYKMRLTNLPEDTVKIYKSSRGAIIETDTEVYVAPNDPRDAEIVSIVDARGPVDYPSPYGYSWRLLTGWMFVWVFAWITLLNTFLDAIMFKHYTPGTVEWLGLIWFITVMYTLFGVVVPRLYQPTIRYSGYVEVGYDPPYRVLAPSCSPWDTNTVDECVKYYGGVLTINVPKGVKEYLDELSKDHTGYTLSVALLSRLDEGVRFKKTISELKRRMYEQTEAAKALIRVEPWRYLRRMTLARLLVFLLFAGVFMGIGFVLGYMFGSNWKVSLHAPHAAANQTLNHTGVSPPVATVQRPVQPTITPAPMPPPPLGTATATITPAKPPSPTTTTVTITPAKPPQPPLNTTTITITPARRR